LRLGRLQYFISQFCNTKNLLRPQKKWLKISLTNHMLFLFIINRESDMLNSF
jgi:hypothetical protein